MLKLKHMRALFPDLSDTKIYEIIKKLKITYDLDYDELIIPMEIISKTYGMSIEFIRETIQINKKTTDEKSVA